MLLPMTRRHISHGDIGMRSQRPASIRLLTPELLTSCGFVWCELTWYLSSCSLGDPSVLKVDIGFCGPNEVGRCTGLLRQCGIGGCGGGGSLKESGPVAVGAGSWLSGTVWVYCTHERRVIVRLRREWLCERVTGIRGGSGVTVRGTVWPTSCGCLRLGVVYTIGVVGGLGGLVMRF
jgi:hypothetical protein